MIVKIGRSKDINHSVSYLFGKSHNPEVAERNLKVSSLNMLYTGEDPKPYINTMNYCWQHRLSDKAKVKIRTAIVSFSKKELDAWQNDTKQEKREDDITIAEHIAREFAIKVFGRNRPILIATQADNDERLLHCHIVTSNIDYDGNPCDKKQYHCKSVQGIARDVASKYINLDYGKKSKPIRTQVERRKVKEAEELRKYNPHLSHDEYRQLLIKKGKYCHKEDMRYLIIKARNKVDNENDFINELNKVGIKCEKKSSKKYGDMYVYDYIGCPVTVLTHKMRSIKLGYDYSPEAVRDYWGNPSKSQEDIVVSEPMNIQPEPQSTDDTDKEDNIQFKTNKVFTAVNTDSSTEQLKSVQQDKDILRSTINCAENLLERIQQINNLQHRNQETQDSLGLEYIKGNRQKDRTL